MSELFGTDGIRGHAGDYPLDEATVRKIGAAFAECFSKQFGRAPRFVSGRDTRESGESIETAFHEGALDRGANGESAGVITTPGVAFLTSEFEFDAGIVISASHNPFQDNGIKIFMPSGKKLGAEAEACIENGVSNAADLKITPNAFSNSERADEFGSAYLSHLSNQFSGLDLSGISIVVDCANGAASDLAPSLFRLFGAEPKVIFNTPDGKNINQDCGSLHLDKLQRAVVENGADFGAAFDGDADRALFVDEKGEVVDGDATLWILANRLKERDELNSNKVIATVMSNIGLEIALREKGIELVRTPVGDKYVLDELLRSKAAIGGEQSGHIILPERSLVGDGMMTALLVLQALTESGRKFSELHRECVRYPQILLNVRVKEKRPFESVPAIMEAADEVDAKLGETGRLLLRYSGTEKLARVMIEGRDQAEIENYATSIGDVIEKELG
ncbi:MAG: phosphoglucosamine mutase [Pyrinomonadaceae bacterium]